MENSRHLVDYLLMKPFDWTVVGFAIIFIIVVAMLSGCAVRAYGRMTCEGKCELVIDREVSELNPIPLPPIPNDKEK